MGKQKKQKQNKTKNKNPKNTKKDKQENVALHCSSCRTVSACKATSGSGLSHVGTSLVFIVVQQTSHRNNRKRNGTCFESQLRESRDVRNKVRM